MTLHCLVHLISPEMQKANFPAIYNIIYSKPGSPEHYTLGAMVVWATCPYALWQLSYHFLITVRRRDKIAAGEHLPSFCMFSSHTNPPSGRPTSFTWLRKSYAKNFLGKLVLSLPDPLQEPAFMMIQYLYALLTMLPCPIWFWYRWASASFLMTVFTWATYNGATYYIDVFGKRMEKELEKLKKDVQKWQNTPEGRIVIDDKGITSNIDRGVKVEGRAKEDEGLKSQSTDDIPLLDQKEGTTARGENEMNAQGVRQR